MKTDPKARYQGYSFFFREGFCWNNVLNPNARLLKTKLKLPTVNDVGSMSLMSTMVNIPNYYFVILLNSNLLFDYYREFINCTVNIQINDIRQLPIVIPSEEQLSEYNMLFQSILHLKQQNAPDTEISKIEYKLDQTVLKLYQI